MRRSAFLVASALITVSCSCAYAQEQNNTTPYVTPRVDVDVTYEVTGPDNATYTQRLRWSAAHWQQRLDMSANGLVMLTDYRAHRLSVVDMNTKTYSVSGSPDAQFAPPGQKAAGSWQKGGADQVAGQSCSHWNSVDTDGQAGDFCYTEQGVLLSASRNGVLFLKALSYAETPQGPDVFKEPESFHEAKAVKLDH